jgi:small subunit ribosomal protein S21
MLKVEIKSGESIDQALKRLKYKVIKSKQNQILYEKKEYSKPSVLKRNQLINAKYKEKMKNP